MEETSGSAPKGSSFGKGMLTFNFFTCHTGRRMTSQDHVKCDMRSSMKYLGLCLARTKHSKAKTKQPPPQIFIISLSIPTHYSSSSFPCPSIRVSVTLHFCHIRHSPETVRHAKLYSFPLAQRTGQIETSVSSRKSS